MSKFSRVSASTLTESRLDANYYAKRYLDNEHKLASCGILREKVGTISELCNCGATPVDVSYSGSGAGLIRTSDVRPDIFKGDGVLRTSDIQIKDLRQSVIARPGDLLYTMSGTVGYACVMPEDGEPMSFSNTIARVRFPSSSQNDARYVAAFFNSRFGYEQSLRLVSGGIQGHVMPNPFKELLVVLPNGGAQRYIGDKVRQAERLRAWAKTIEGAVNRFHAALVPEQKSLDFSRRVRIVSQDRMTERLDAHFYPAVVDEYLRSHRGKFKKLGALCASVFNGQTQPEASEGGIAKQVTVANLSASFLVGVPREVDVPATKTKYLERHDVLICNAAHNKSYIGRDLTYVHSDAALLPSTEVMTIRVDRSQVPASYVRSYLSSQLGFVQIQSTIRGITAHSYPGDVRQLEIYVPDVRAEQRQDWFACDEMLAMAGAAFETATALTGAAKLFVEALIEGQVTEADLIAAQQALSSGNDQLDRALLARLKVDGVYGSEGDPLFPDLDQVYGLSAQAADA
ncbi:restriction endonuclease subunit S domain-containing protein [Paraburkholderia sediminicola]|uniref:hypothetical protein n=1 Tax=Paraburkholderia sediminicola TaxID=458836 RepID=UPI0038BAD567